MLFAMKQRYGILFGISALLAVLALGGPALHAQPEILVLSPDEPTGAGLQAESRIESAAKVGNITLAVWGTTLTELPATTFHTELWMVLLHGASVAGEPVRVHDDPARPYGVVSVLNLRDRFLVLWNDRSSGGTIMSRLVDTLGRFAGPEHMLASGALARDAHVWLDTGATGYTLVWGSMVDTVEHFSRVDLDSLGLAKGTPREIVTANFDNDLTFTELPGAHILRDSAGPNRFVHADGHTDPRPVIAAFVANPHYIYADTSIQVIETNPAGDAVIATHPSIFDTAITARTPVVIPGATPPTVINSLRRSIAGLCRDSAGQPLVLVDVEKLSSGLGQPGSSLGGWLEHWTVGPGGTRLDSVWTAPTYSWLNYDAGKFTLTGGNLVHQFTAGDNNALRLRYDWVQYSSNRNGDVGQTPEHAVVWVDRYGNTYTADPLAMDAAGHNSRVRALVNRSFQERASTITISPDSGTGVTVSVPFIPDHTIIYRRYPALARFGDDIVVGWKRDAANPTFLFSIWQSEAHTIGDRGQITFPQHPINWAGGETFAQTALVTRLGDRFLLSHRDRLVLKQGNRFDTYSSYTLAEPTATGTWDTLLRWTSLANAPITGELPSVIDPDSNIVHAGLIGANNELYSIRISKTRTDIAELPAHAVYAMLPFANNVVIVASDGWALRFRGSALLDSFRLEANPSNDHALYQRLRGDRFLRWFPLHSLRPDSTMRDSLARFELWSAAGELLAATDVVIGGERFDAFAFERPTDHALLIASGDARGVHLAVLDSALHLRLADSVVVFTNRPARDVVMNERGDSAWYAWQDYNPSNAAINGAIVPLPGAARLTTDTDDSPEPTVFVVRSVFPNPANERITIQIETADNAAPGIEVYDAIGRRAATGVARFGSNRTWQAEIDARALRPGAYGIVVTDRNGARHVEHVVILH